ncbi:O-antigen ligase family protein [Sphingorhabdus contaminans]|uniref:O-antigen ligase family protein n=1 Tax=Sphingorhabdus contaminans TaxID=1343899 RepID=UPI003D2C844D
MTPSLNQKLQENSALILMVAYLTLVMLTGGSGRDDTQALLVLRPLTIVFLGFAIWPWLNGMGNRGRYFLISSVSLLVVTALYLIPLPGGVWVDLPMRDILADIDRSVFGEVSARPLALNPLSAWENLNALLVPITAVLLMLRLNERQRRQILPIVICFGLFSGLLGMMQSISSGQSSLYFYRITNNGSAVGLFANRNHQALLLCMLYPMLAGYVAIRQRSKSLNNRVLWFALLAGAPLIPLILVTGSRSGLVLAVVGLLLAFCIYWQSQKAARQAEGKKIPKWPVAAAAIMIAGLFAATLHMSRAEAFQRFFGSDGSENRLAFWKPIYEMANALFPVGSGPGGFPNAYSVFEPNGLLDPSYLNHAHNDWLEIFVTHGALAISLIIATIGFLSYVAYCNFYRVQSSSRLLSFVGIATVVIAILGSIGDYPMRTPIISTIIAISVVWSMYSSESSGNFRQQDPKFVD